MKKTALIFLIFLVAFLSACSSTDSQTYNNNFSLWQSKAIAHYRFNLKIACTCAWSALMPLTVEVQKGEVVSISASNGADVSPYLDSFSQYDTVQRLFDRVYISISREESRLKVKYDRVYGFPAAIEVDPNSPIQDVASGYYVTNFEVLP